MTRFRVEYSDTASEQIEALYLHLAHEANPDIAHRYVGGLVDFCDSFELFPDRGNKRDDIRPGLRVTNYRKRTVVAFAVDHEAQVVQILEVYHGGQDYEHHLEPIVELYPRKK